MKEFIERNKLLEEIEYFISHTNDECPEHYAYKTCKRIIENMSIADVVEVKHGKWIRHINDRYIIRYECGEPIWSERIYYECSCCGCVEDFREPYCNCGAKMDIA